MMNKSDLPHLKALLREVEDGIGGEVWDILHSWERGPQRPAAPGERGGGLAGAEDVDAARDRLEDARCARWWAEYVDLVTNLQAPLRRMLKLHDLATIEDRRQRNHDGTFDPLLAAEAAAAGYCRSCWRLDQQLVEIETDKNGHRYYRDLCRDCGGYKHDTGQEPSMDMLRIRQRRKWNTADLVKANARKGRKAS